DRDLDVELRRGGGARGGARKVRTGEGEGGARRGADHAMRGLAERGADLARAEGVRAGGVRLEGDRAVEGRRRQLEVLGEILLRLFEPRDRRRRRELDAV